MYVVLYKRYCFQTLRAKKIHFYEDLNFKGEGKVAAAHVAATKEHLLLDDVPRDRRFAEGLKWIDAQVALIMPVIKPDGECYAIIELYRTFNEPYDNVSILTDHIIKLETMGVITEVRTNRFTHFQRTMTNILCSIH